MIRYTILLLLLTISARAQITLEHTHNSIVNVYNLEDEGYKYMGVNTGVNSSTIFIYNEDHSLWKKVIPPIPSKSYSISASALSTKLFNSNGAVEMIITYIDTSAGLSNWKGCLEVIDENGASLLKLIRNQTSMNGSIHKVGNRFKMFVYDYTNAKTDVYDLPGKMLNVQKPGKGQETSSSFYPNPMNSAATLSYTLPDGVQQGNIQVYNSQGVLVRSYPVSNNSGFVSVERGALPAGNYIYQVQTTGAQQASHVFTVQ